MTPPLWILLLAGAALVGVAACSSLRSSPSKQYFQMDQHYEVRRAASIRTVGQRGLLVLPQKDEKVMVAAGTTLQVVRMVRDNTLTRGIELWPEAELLDGAHRGERVFLPPDSKDWLQTVDRPTGPGR